MNRGSVWVCIKQHSKTYGTKKKAALNLSASQQNVGKHHPAELRSLLAVNKCISNQTFCFGAPGLSCFSQSEQSGVKPPQQARQHNNLDHPGAEGNDLHSAVVIPGANSVAERLLSNFWRENVIHKTAECSTSPLLCFWHTGNLFNLSAKIPAPKSLETSPV